MIDVYVAEIMKFRACMHACIFAWFVELSVVRLCWFIVLLNMLHASIWLWNVNYGNFMIYSVYCSFGF